MKGWNGVVGRLYKLLISAAVLLTVVQQFPVIRETAYYGIRAVLYGLFIVFSLVGVAKLGRTGRIPKLLLLFMLAALAWLMVCGVFLLLGWKVYAGDVVELFIPLGILLTGYTVRFSEGEQTGLLIAYGAAGTAMGLALIAYYGSGFSIVGQYITKKAMKNQTGPIVVSASIIVLYMLLASRPRRKKPLLMKAFLAGLLVISVSASLILRNRAGLAALVIIAFIMLFLYFAGMSRAKSPVRMILLLVVLAAVIEAGLASQLVKPFYDSFTMSFKVDDMDSLSARRIGVYADGLDIVGRYPLFGLAPSGRAMNGIPHNYVLNKLVYYGFLGALPLLVLYFGLIVFAAGKLLAGLRYGRRVPLAAYLLIMALVISLLEYAYPYAPGVSLIFVWFTLGQHLRGEAPAGSQTPARSPELYNGSRFGNPS